VVNAVTPVTTTIDGPVAVIRVDNPPVNALSDHILDGLVAAIAGIPPSPAVRAVVLTGTGTKAFLAGADLTEFVPMVDSPARIADHVARTRRVLDELARLDVPVIAAVQGLALGGGLEFALACDLVVADETVRLGCPEVRLGLIPGAGGTQRLVALLGRFRAAELIMTGRLLSAIEAADLGLVTRVVKAGTAFDEAIALATELAAAPAVAVQAAKRAVRTADALSLPAALEFERREFLATLASDDAREGLGAFLAKRPPAFTHR
jgi:enoyl-CoA hydratase/carnithine racemase